MEAAAWDLLLLYFCPLLPVVFMLWLWSLNVRHFELRRVEYELCFSIRERKFLAPHADLARVRGCTVLPPS